jgi:hypothetical protein
MNHITSEEEIERIRQLAARVVVELKAVSGINFGFNRESVEWVEGFIERYRRSKPGNSEPPSGLVNSFGAFLGESIALSTNERWEWSSEVNAWGILFSNGNWVFPFAKVMKQFENGIEHGESIASFYDIAVDYVATGKLANPTDKSPGS